MSIQPNTFIYPNTKKEITIYRPLIPIRIAHSHKISRGTVRSLIDSGADRNLFPFDWGEYIGIDLKKKGKPVEIMGIGGIGVQAYEHPITLYLGTYSFLTVADFSPYQTVPLLGRNGFFNHFKRVVFIEKEHYLELEY